MENNRTIQLSKEAQAQIKLIMIEDYQQQLEQLKQSKSKYEYIEYRRKYMLYHNMIKHNKKDFERLMTVEQQGG